MMIRLPTTTNAFQTRLPVNNNVVQRIKASRKNLHHKTVEGKRLSSFKNNDPNYNHYHTTKLSAATTDDENQSEEEKATLLGTLVLLTVPISWGTYVPVGESAQLLNSVYYTVGRTL